MNANLIEWEFKIKTTTSATNSGGPSDFITFSPPDPHKSPYLSDLCKSRGGNVISHLGNSMQTSSLQPDRGPTGKLTGEQRFNQLDRYSTNTSDNTGMKATSHTIENDSTKRHRAHHGQRS